MCGNTNTPSLVGRLVKVTQTSRIGSYVLGAVREGVIARIEEELELTAFQRAAFEAGNPGETAPDYFYNVSMVKSAVGKDSIASLNALAGQIVLFPDEFELAD